MIKKIVTIALCCLAITLSGCSANKYQRISFNNQTLGQKLEYYIDNDTEVVNEVEKDFPSTLPIYKVSKRKITKDEIKKMGEQLGISASTMKNPFEVEDGNYLYGEVASSDDGVRGYFDMADEELEKLSWDIFKKLPFMDGKEDEYEYLGIKATTTISDSEGEHLCRVGVSFRRRLDGMRVLGCDRCFLYFDGSGLVEVSIELYEYKKVGTMETVPLNEAESKIKEPDSFDVEATGQLKKISRLQTDDISFLWCNQYVDGCEILEPMYVFSGTATDVEGTQGEFTSIVVGIPEKYTYEKKSEDQGMVEWMP